MKNIKKYQLIILFLLLCFVAKGQTEAQQIVPQSPTIGSLIQYADCPVSYYSGTPNISIPLYEINVDNFKIPISLSYNASGIKVAQEASWVGLGWSLNAGGCISRSVQCYDDFLEFEYPGIAVTKGYYDDKDITNSGSSEYYSYIYTSTGLKLQLVKDSEPDIFYYSFLGYSGKFILDKARGAVLFDKSSNLKIVVNNNSSKRTFTVIAPDGTEYVFENREKAYLYSRNGSLHNNNLNATKWDDTETSFPGSPVEYVSSWLLSKIITPNKREVLFSYKAELFKSPVQESCIKYNFLSYSGNNTACGKNTTYPYYSTSKAVYETFRLDKISWDNGYIVFNSSDREDIKLTTDSPQKLEGIQVYNQMGELVKGYNLRYSYFNGNKAGSYDYVFKRLRLDNIIDVFDNNCRYTFNYFSGALPAKNSKNTDYWGYYNGGNYGGNYYAPTFYGNTFYTGAARNSNLSYLKIGTLQSIQYPTGGVETFTYEEHTFRGSATISGYADEKSYKFYVYNKDKIDDYPDAPTDTSFTFTLSRTTEVYITGYMEAIGSSRNEHYNYENDVLSIYSLNPSRKRFSHTASEIYGEDYVAVNRRVTLDAGTYVFNVLLPPPDTYANWTFKYDELIYPLSSTKCRGGGLRIAQIDGGGKKREFTYSDGLILVDPVVSYLETITCGNNGAIEGRFQYLVQTSESVVPLSSFRNGNYVGYDMVKETVKTNKGESSIIYNFFNQQEELVDEHPYVVSYINFKNGLLSSVQYCQGSTVLKQELYEYEDVYSQLIRAFKFLPGDMTRHPYDYRVEWNNRSMHTIINRSSKYSSVNEEGYTYNEHMLPKLKKSKPYDKRLEEKTYYPIDYSDAVYQRMVDDNYVNVPIEQLSLVDGQVVSGHKISFKDTLNMYLPCIKYVLDAKFPLSEISYDSAYKAQVYYDIYNKYGKLLQKRENGTSVVYLWSYKGEYPVVEIRNASYTAVASELSKHGITIDTLCEKAFLTSDDIVTLNTLRTALPQSLITIYTYKPLVGVTSITLPDGLTTYYEYDVNGRLKESFYKEAAERRVLQHYNYHYTNANK